MSSFDIIFNTRRRQISVAMGRAPVPITEFIIVLNKRNVNKIFTDTDGEIFTNSDVEMATAKREKRFKNNFTSCGLSGYLPLIGEGFREAEKENISDPPMASGRVGWLGSIIEMERRGFAHWINGGKTLAVRSRQQLPPQALRLADVQDHRRELEIDQQR